MENIIGLLAGTLTTIAFIPQLLKIHATQSGKDVSARMFVIFSVGVGLWLVYGILIRSAPIIIANLLTLVLALAILCMKIRYARREAGRRPR